MTYQTNRTIPAAKAIDDFQDSISRPDIRASKDRSGAILLTIPLALVVVGVICGIAQRVMS